MELLLSFNGVAKTYKGRAWRNPPLHTAIKDFSLDVFKGETVGLIGESGSGKTTVGRITLGLTRPTAGKVSYKDTDILRLNKEGLREYRKKVQGLFQDASGTLDPLMTIGNSLLEVIFTHNGRAGARSMALELLQLVNLSENVFDAYPHELSGGQKQRVGLARCLALNPELLVCDEPVSSLDISVQARILRVFRQLQAQRGLAYLFISHDLRVIRYISHRIAVMYKGYLLEVATADSLFANPGHPYSRLLISSMPRLFSGSDSGSNGLEGPVEPVGATGGPREWEWAPAAPPESPRCPYFLRCPDRAEICGKVLPSMREIAPGHWVRCFG